MNSRRQRPNADAVAICPAGLEEICADELRALGIKVGGPTAGVVPFRGSTRAVYEANLWLRTATRILVRLARFRATDFAHLERRMEDVDLGPFLTGHVAPRFRVTSRKSALFHTAAVTERLHKIVGEPKQDDAQPEQVFVVRIDHDTVTVSVDTTGEPLHKRSWRTETVGASLRPTLAAAAILVSAWDRTTPVLDPFAGSGTFVIEAGLIAAARPPSTGRSYAFQRWSSFEGGTWASVKGGAATRTREQGSPKMPLIEANDRDAAALAATQANAERAGIEVTTQLRPVGQMAGLGGPGLVVSNPPYGKRSSGGPKGISPLYKRFGEVVRERRPHHTLTVVVPSDAATIDRRLKTVVTTSNGGIRVRIATSTPKV
ncbi:MAG: class I SAM-dependent RNA methyltransferase [Acidimicrobiia bacterium]|nr:class I SAM-dependent RNA methyltransferase [Acidimicrobiia bacterium]